MLALWVVLEQEQELALVQERELALDFVQELMKSALSWLVQVVERMLGEADCC